MSSARPRGWRSIPINPSKPEAVPVKVCAGGADSFKGSENLERVLGLGPEHPRTRAGWRQVIHPSDHEALDAYLQRTMAVRGILDYQYRIIHGIDQSERWVHSLARLDYAPEGTALRMVGSIQDITSSRAAEQNRLAEEQRCQRQRNALIQLATAALPSDDGSLSQAFQRLTEVAARTLEVDRVSIWRYNGPRPGIRCLDLYQRPAVTRPAWKFRRPTTWRYCHALTESDVLAADDVHWDP